ncbi:MAG: hypothetical protein ACTSP4_10365 [Candidatus Hodarchaeales archaeon]
MNDDKRGRGRPRKYNTDAERKKAYRIRKKEKIKKLEARLIELEKEMENMSDITKRITPELAEVHEEITVPWMKLTPMDIASMETKKLKRYSRILQHQTRTPQNPLYAGLSALARPTDNAERVSYWKLHERKLSFIESFQQVVLIYLIEAEIASREREMKEEYLIDKLEDRIGELEKNLKKNNDIESI